MRALIPEAVLVSLRLFSRSIHTDKLLEEHETDSSQGTLPASTSKAVKPRLNLKLDTVHARRSLKVRMPLNTNFVIESDLGAYFAPFLEDTGVVSGKISKLSEHDSSLIVAAFTTKPARGKRQEDDTF
jgi:hypothetical protein